MSKTICVIEDDRVLAEYIKTMLSGNYKVDIFCEDKDFYTIDIGNYDLILLDFNLGSITGVDLFRSFVNPPPTVLISCVNSVLTVSEFMDAGGLSFILKPIGNHKVFNLQIDSLFLYADVVYRNKINQKIGEKYTQFMSFIAHELRTPLTAIASNIRFMVEDIDSGNSEALAEDISEIQNNCNRLLRFIDSAADLNKIESDTSVNKIRSNLKEHIKKEVDTMSGNTDNRSFEFTYSGPEIVNIDRTYFNRLLLNLLDNAVKYSDHCSTIYVNVEQSSSNMLCSIKNTGITIPDVDIKRIFTRFYRTSDVRSKIEGLGLGLEICKMIVEMHCGEIWAKSSEGETSIFFTIPIANN